MIELLSPPILSAAQFSRDDVLLVADISAGVLKGILDRKQVTLTSDHNPGTGRRRMFTGGDILKISAANVSSNIGFPLRWAYLLSEQIWRRASARLSGTALEPCDHFAMAFYPNKAGDDWAFVPVFDGKAATPLPIAHQAFDIDRFIDETIAKLTAIVNDEALPTFDLPEPKPFDWRSMFSWAKDATGRETLVGLDYAETTEFFQLDELWKSSRSMTANVTMTDEQSERLDTLTMRHRKADMLRYTDRPS